MSVSDQRAHRLCKGGQGVCAFPLCVVSVVFGAHDDVVGQQG